MKICSIEGCTRECLAKGLCRNHYNRQRYVRHPRIKRICTANGCQNKYWQHGFCRKHFARFKRLGSPNLPDYPKICKVEGCNKILGKRSMTGMCALHYRRSKDGVPLTLPFYEINRGSRNANWNGGIFEYPNHYQMKKTRKQILESANYKCSHCGGTARIAHHLDKTKSNHVPENFISLCQKCHIRIYHSGPRKPYGKRIYTLENLKERINIGL